MKGFARVLIIAIIVVLIIVFWKELLKFIYMSIQVLIWSTIISAVAAGLYILYAYLKNKE